MTRRADLITLAVAVVVHGGVALALARNHASPPRPPRRPIEVEFRKPAPPPPAPERVAADKPAPAPEAPPPRHKLAARPRTPQPPAPPVASPPPEKTAPVKPMFGVSMDSTTAVASADMAVPVGQTTLGDPSGPRKLGRGGPPGPSSEYGDGAYKPVSELEVGTLPDIDTDACGRTISYPAEAERNGIAGEVRLRVALDARGKVQTARVLAGLGHGLDQAALDAIKHRCRFTPAKDKKGEPVAFVIQSYTFRFELPQ